MKISLLYRETDPWEHRGQHIVAAHVISLFAYGVRYIRFWLAIIRGCFV